MLLHDPGLAPLRPGLNPAALQAANGERAAVKAAKRTPVRRTGFPLRTGDEGVGSPDEES